jgi:hypothetical protein
VLAPEMIRARSSADAIAECLRLPRGFLRRVRDFARM